MLLLSAHANASIHVKHEVERATSKRKRVIPVRLEEVPPGPSLELHLATAQWLDVWRLPIDQVASELAAAIRQESSKPTPTPGPVTPAITPSSDQRPLKIVPKGLRSFDAHCSTCMATSGNGATTAMKITWLPRAEAFRKTWAIPLLW